jgi:hypothetical protein
MGTRHIFGEPRASCPGRYHAICSCGAIAIAPSKTSLLATMEQHSAGGAFPAAWTLLNTNQEEGTN